ncbi:MAG: carboxymuconolactone decarboxylase family protein [Acidimicrobiia bacterium]|nr:carboxymuconolactone decarboxylase family protein [Acidimicrobiia bacterium]
MPRPPRPTTPRLAPIGEPTPEQAEVLAKAGARPGRRAINIFTTMVRNRRVANRAVILGGAFLGKGTIAGRDREIVILRVGHNASAEYEFGQHTVIGRREGLTDAEIADLASDELTGQWSNADRTLVAMADELCSVDCVSDATWTALAERYSDEQLVELLMLAGYYRMISGFLNSTGVQLDDGVPGWPGGTS